MVWAKFDDGFDENPKIEDLGDAAFRAYVCGVTYCNRNRTDGFISTARALKLAGKPKVVQELTLKRSGGPGKEPTPLWAPIEGGFMIHDYLEYQPSRAQIEEAEGGLSAKRSKAGTKGAAKRWQAYSKRMATGMANVCQDDGKPIANAWQTHSPDPDPDPDHSIAIAISPVNAHAHEPLEGDYLAPGEAPEKPKRVKREKAAPREITEPDLLALQDEFPTLDVRDQAQRRETWMDAKGKRGQYKDHVQALRNWLRTALDDQEARGTRPRAAAPVVEAPRRSLRYAVPS